jgi:hypothetical protein
MDLDGEVRTPQFALHTLDAGLGLDNLDDKGLHLQNSGGTELNADAASFAISFDDLDPCGGTFLLDSFV